MREPDIWLHHDQVITSTVTSVNSKRLPALFQKVLWTKGTRNADLGAGKYSNVSDYLSTLGVSNFRFDPFCLSRVHNAETIPWIRAGQCDTCTCTNTVNVIQCPRDRQMLFRRAADTLKIGGFAYFQFHEGDRTGCGRVSQRDKAGRPTAWQENRRTADYLRDIERVLRVVGVWENVIVAMKMEM